MITFRCLTLAFIVFTQCLFGMSIERIGSAYLDNGVEWQAMKYENDDSGFEVKIPGSPASGMANGDVYVYSRYQNVDYEIHCSLNGRYKPPKTEKKFMQEIENLFSKDAKITAIPSNQKKVKYIAELNFINGSKTVRIYCSKNCLYWVIVQGPDLSLAPQFYESVNITH